MQIQARERSSAVYVRHSRHEEYITAVLETAEGRRIDLGGRAHHQLLLELARVRLDDRGAGLPASEQGWIHIAELERRLAIGATHINIYVYRLRQQLSKLDPGHGTVLIERRCGIGELRLASAAVEVGLL